MEEGKGEFEQETEKEKKDWIYEQKKKKLQRIARTYYERKDVQKALVEQASRREIAIVYYDIFGKRPDILTYDSEVANVASKGATSFHVSEEIWENPLELQTGMTIPQLSKMRLGWDMLIDIDCKYIEYSKAAAELLKEAFYFHNIRNFGIKFSGGSGIHMILPFKAFPKEVSGIVLKGFFPQMPRAIISYLKEMISQSLGDSLLNLNPIEEISNITGKSEQELMPQDKFDPFQVVTIDNQLISSRHLYRMAYSLNEKKGLVSHVIRADQLKNFVISWAKPDNVYVKKFVPEPEENEAYELVLQALDWQARDARQRAQEIAFGQLQKTPEGQAPRMREDLKLTFNPEIFPPCMLNILEGMKKDGRKRALFVLVNFFRSIGLSFEEIERHIKEWNQKNYQPLREGYIRTQLDWFKKNKQFLPPNCNLHLPSTIYKDIGVCMPDHICQTIKNPVQYAAKKARILEQNREETKKSKKK